jgi:23S rRNA (cytidine1920-2'-O)/16S rRNA (cytidine1409-2'-O)-methyltransferase
MARRPAAGKAPLLDLLDRQFPEYSRDELYRYVMCGEVRVDGAREVNPKQPVSLRARLVITTRRFVSRGGEKLDAALRAWGIEPRGRVWLDAGASTGGFTDCLLQANARAVHAVDVGYNQLDYRLRADPRVIVHERTNIAEITPVSLDPDPHAAVCDLSFRSLRGVLRSILSLTREGWGMALLKPQFELAAEERWSRRETRVPTVEDASSGAVPDETPGTVLDAGGGVVSGAAREAVIRRVCRVLAEEEGVAVHRMMDSPVAGREGNREVLLLVGLADLRNPRPGDRVSSADPGR